LFRRRPIKINECLYLFGEKAFLIGEQLLVEFFCFLSVWAKKKDTGRGPFSLMFTYSAGLYDEPVC